MTPEVSQIASSVLALQSHAARSTSLPFTLIPANFIVSGTLLLYDYLCTLEQELAYVWSRPWSLGSLMFLLNRYLPFVDTFLNFGINFGTMNAQQCLRATHATIWLIYVGMSLSELILMLRTYGLWERSRSILLALSITAVLLLIPGVIIVRMETRSFRFEDTTAIGCRATAASNIVFIAYVLLLVYEIIVAGLTVVKGYRHLRRTSSPWVIQMYQDGILFYVYLVALSIGNILSSVINPGMGPWLVSLQRVLHSLLANRVFFVMFSKQYTDSRRTETFSMTSSLPVLSADLVEDETHNYQTRSKVDDLGR
ncbi:hypothetical protein L218DRAFT_962658 [Marasmius fiardii PR-910]|nr:hypothetical protein L218DRAFT_962658 [Marasmius fiardii PR-910]